MVQPQEADTPRGRVPSGADLGETERDSTSRCVVQLAEQHSSSSASTNPLVDEGMIAEAEAAKRKRAPARRASAVEELRWWDESPVVPFMAALVAGAMTFGFLALFTGMGAGAWYIIVSRRNESIAFGFGCAALVLAVGLGLLDAPNWKSDRSKRLRCWLAVAASLCAVAYVMVSVDKYAYGPLCFYLIALPILLLATQVFLRRCAPRSDAPPVEGLEAFGRRAAAPLAFVGLVVFCTWAGWVSQNGWPASRRKYGQRLSNNGVRCRETYDENWMDDQDIKDLTPYAECLEVFLLWVTPFVVAVALGLVALVARTLAVAETIDRKVAACVLGVFAGLWAAASLAGAGHGVSTALFAAAAAGTLAFAGVATYVVGFDGVVNGLSRPDSAAAKAWGRFGAPYIDVWRGLAVVVAWPAFAGYLAYSAAHEAVRRCRGSDPAHARAAAPARGGSRKRISLTREAAENVAQMARWNWTPVLRYAALWGVGLVALSVVVSKFTVLLMSIVVSASKDASLGVATAVIAGTGMTLFLLPPVPGAPIYLAAGVLLVANGKANGFTVVPMMVYAAGCSLVIKLSACVLQQKVIGANLKRYVWVRQLCSVNSEAVRTTRFILQKPGLSVAKVALLVGGPDWPTSVLCGILGLGLAPIVVGTLPVFFLIAPTVVGGAFLVIDESYASFLSVLFVSAAAGLQGGSLLVAAYYLDAELGRCREEIAHIPLDEEVRKADEAALAGAARLRANTVWERVPHVWRCALALATALMTAACYMVTLWASACFREFAIDDTVSKRLKGDWRNIIRPAGVYALALFAASCLLHLAFHFIWYARQGAAPKPARKHRISFKMRPPESDDVENDQL